MWEGEVHSLILLHAGPISRYFGLHWDFFRDFKTTRYGILPQAVRGTARQEAFTTSEFREDILLGS